MITFECQNLTFAVARNYHCFKKAMLNSSSSLLYVFLQHFLSDFEPEYFWQWTDFQSYVEATMCFISIGSLVMYLLIKFDPFVEAVGFLAVFTEAMLGTPQFYRNYQNKSTLGMR